MKRIINCTNLLWISIFGITAIFLYPPQLLMAQVKVTGKIIEEQSGEPVPFVHIYKKNTLQGTVSDDLGRFTVTISRIDTLIFSAVGYEKYEFVPDPLGKGVQQDVIIRMVVKSYELDPVNVNAYQSLEEFKRDILQLDLPKESKGFELNIPRGYTLPPTGPGDINQNPSVSMGGPFSALYNKFSREAKEKKKLVAYHVQANNNATVASRYNMDVVMRVTSLEEEMAKSFMEWCTFEDEFILRVSEYELTAAILHCLEEFSSIKLLDKK